MVGLVVFYLHTCFFYPFLSIVISIWMYSRVYGLNLSINHLSPVISDMNSFSLVYFIFNSISNVRVFFLLRIKQNFYVYF